MNSQRSSNGRQEEQVGPILRRSGGRHSYPLSLSQQHTWFQCQLDSESSLYNLGVLMGVYGPLNVADFVRAIQNTVDRHEILRTIFVVSDDVPLQKVVDGVKVECPVRDLPCGLSEREGYEKAWARLSEVGNPPYDLTCGPLFRAELLRGDDHHHYLVLGFHHLLLDAFYSGQWMKEIISAYDSLRKGHALPPAPELQYGDFSVWQKARFDQGLMNESVAFWQEELRVSPLDFELPCDRTAPAPRPIRSHISLVLDAAVTARLREVGKQARTTLFRVVLSVFTVFFSRLTDSGELLFDIDFSTRPREMGHTIGFFANLLPVRVKLDEERSFVELVRAVDQQLRNVTANREFPVRQLTRKLKGRRDAMQPLSPVVVTQLGSLDWTLGDLSLNGMIYVTASVHDLWLGVLEREDELEILLGYPDEVFERSRIQSWADNIELLVAQVTENPEATLACIASQEGGDWPTLDSATAGQLEEVMAHQDS